MLWSAAISIQYFSWFWGLWGGCRIWLFCIGGAWGCDNICGCEGWIWTITNIILKNIWREAGSAYISFIIAKGTEEIFCWTSFTYTLKDEISILTGCASDVRKAGLTILDHLPTSSAGGDKVTDHQEVWSLASGAKISFRANGTVGRAGLARSFRGLEFSWRAEVSNCDGEAGQEKHKLPKFGVHFLGNY